MRKVFIMMCGAVMVLLLVACGGNNVDGSTSEKYITQAKEIISLLNEGDYETVHSKFDEEMKTGLPVEDMEELTPIIEESGNFEEIDKASVEEKDGLYVAVLVGNYSDDNRVFTITFNDSEEVAGLFIQ
ncbi:DUF3887 domain-containing protein [Virgibacillus kimchii]